MSDPNAILEAKNVTKIYGYNKSTAAKMMSTGSDKDSVYENTGSTVALWDVSFQVKKGEIFVIIGLSGSGKSTVIRCFNQLLKPTFGHVYFDGRQVDTMPPKELLALRRNRVSMVFQNFGLFSHRSVLENVAYSLELRGSSKKDREEKAYQLIQMVGLKGQEDQPISSLSGGMKQRVGIARALCSDPDVLLMDEPFSALDPLVRRSMQFELLSIQRKLGKTILFITHDIDEAFKLGDTVAIMRDGKIVQINTPEQMSLHPADEYVHQFIEGANMAQVLTVRHIMITPTCLVREQDSPVIALRAMRKNGFSSAYVVDKHLHLLGVVSIDKALDGLGGQSRIGDLCKRENLATTTEDTLLSEILPKAAESRYPIAVVDEVGVLKGVVNKASVIASMV